MLDGLKVANPELDVIEDTVVVRKDKTKWCSTCIRRWKRS